MTEILGFKIHLYGLLIGFGVWLAMELALKRKKTTTEKKRLENAFWWALIGGLIGARVYHVVDFWFRYYSNNLNKIFYVWEGGLGIWGAILGGMLAIYLYCLHNKIKFWPMMDSLVIGVPLAQAVGRLGNWVNGEIVGKNGEPLFAYEAVLNLGLWVILWKNADKNKKSGWVTGTYLLGYGLIRIFLEGKRPDEIIWKIYGVPTAIIFGLVSIFGGVWLIRKSQKG